MFHPSKFSIGSLVTMAAGALLVACGGGSSTSKGSLSVGITDMPVDDAERVVIAVAGLAVKPEGGAPEVLEIFEPAVSIDLLDYQNGQVAVLLDAEPFEAGRYEWLRLIVDASDNESDSYIVIDGGECELRIPSGAESGLKMNRPIDLSAGEHVALTIDFDLRKSIKAPTGPQGDACLTGYTLRPTLRLADNSKVGAITGDVDFTLDQSYLSDCDPHVYVFQEAIDLANITDKEPVSMVGVFVREGEVIGSYQAAFLDPGEYTVGYRCDPSDPSAAPGDLLTGDKDVALVEVGGFDMVNFEVPAPAP